MRTTIVALQSKQPFTVAPAAAFPPDEFDLVVVTDGPADAVVREDVTGGMPEVTVVEREKWLAHLRGFEGPVEVVTNDEYCLAECARLREELGLTVRHPQRPLAYLDKVLMKRLLAAPSGRYAWARRSVTSTRCGAIASAAMPARVRKAVIAAASTSILAWTWLRSSPVAV